MSQSSEQCSCFALWKSYVQFLEEETFILGFSCFFSVPPNKCRMVPNLAKVCFLPHGLSNSLFILLLTQIPLKLNLEVS
jgi:hypothetical protein